MHGQLDLFETSCVLAYHPSRRSLPRTNPIPLGLRIPVVAEFTAGLCCRHLVNGKNVKVS